MTDAKEPVDGEWRPSGRSLRPSPRTQLFLIGGVAIGGILLMCVAVALIVILQR